MSSISRNVTAWLEETCRRYPDHCALHDDTGTLTYAEYRRTALALARRIAGLGIRAAPAAVYLEKSIRMLPVFFGIAYSGNFYSPIDPGLPPARIEKMLAILQPQLVVTSADRKSELAHAGYSGDILCIEDIVPAADDADAVLPMQESIGGEDLLYVLFTSGSTGVPKGVAITHRSVINYIDWGASAFSFSADDRIGNQSPFYFDNSILDIYGAVRAGASLYLIPPHLFAQPVPLLAYLRDHRISSIFWVPSALLGPAKLRAFKSVDLSATLRRVLFCGEVMPAKQLNAWRRYLPDVCYANLYGPTEITDACTCYHISRDIAETEPVPIGKPIDNVEVILVADDGHVVTEPDTAGELCVLGVCLSPGYYRNPEKTAESFVPDPRNSGRLMYKTGDLAKYNADGDLIYISRKDFQIKHLGHRIELGELETVADALPGVARSCAVYHADRRKLGLVLECEPGCAPDISRVERALIEQLPRYMVPNKILIIDNMPINSNGKIDRLALTELFS